MEERRSIKRFDLEIPMVIQGKDGMDNAFEVETHSQNISSKGVYFLTRKSVREGSKLNMILCLPSNATIQSNDLQGKNRNKVDIKGTVVRIDSINKNSRKEIGVAMRFDHKSNWGF